VSVENLFMNKSRAPILITGVRDFYITALWQIERLQVLDELNDCNAKCRDYLNP
jgi:hypothetical protein